MQNRCRCCGRLLLSEVGQCTGCRREDSLFRQFPGSPFPVFPYLGRRKRLLTTWKIQGDRSLSLLYARWVYTVLSERFPGIPVVPVPPRKNKMREKGWDQMEELCRILSAVYQVPVLRMLQRTTVIQQKKLNRQQRLGALGADYAPLPEKQLQRVLKSRPVPSEVVLLDDVMTTGATIIHATAALQRSGVEKVHPVTLFYVP